MRRYLAVVALASSTLLSSLPASADTRVYVRVAPPAAVVETRIVAPSPQHIWVAGYHRWDGRAYVWVPGAWVVPPAPHYHHWVAGHWAHHHQNGYYWVEGHWR
jgi:hypothetical protein